MATILSDYHAWLLQQAALLRTRSHGVDADGVADVLQGEAARYADELQEAATYCMQQMLDVMLKGADELRIPALRMSRRKVVRLLRDSPSLRAYLERVLGEVYEDARDRVLGVNNLPDEALPDVCPVSLSDLLGEVA